MTARLNGKRKPLSPLEQFKAAYWPKFSGHLEECERRLVDISSKPGRTLGEACGQTLSAGGKRLRPLLVLLSTARSHEIGSRQYAAAVAVELVHMATLIHDDVLDDAMLRRGKPTLVASHGPVVSKTSGDYLFSQAFMELAGTASPEAVSLLARTSLELSQGELLQMEQTSDFGLSYEAYAERCRLKTAGLFAAACRLGAMFSGCTQKTVEAMARYGYCLGLSFQISDDILDFDGEEAATGKRVGTDLRDGTVTLPLILALELDPSLGDLLAGEPGKDRVEEIIARVGRSGGLEKARERALGYVDEAVAILETVADELDIAPLRLIAGMTVERSV